MIPGDIQHFGRIRKQIVKSSHISGQLEPDIWYISTIVTIKCHLKQLILTTQYFGSTYFDFCRYIRTDFYIAKLAGSM